MEKVKNLFVDIVKEDSNPALGCTEPVAVAFAGAFGSKYITGNIESIRVVTSKSIFKNGKSVIIPKTNSRGLDLAAALGVVAGDPKDEFMIIKNMDESKINHAKEMVAQGIISVTYTEESPSIFVHIIINTDREVVEVYLRNSHIHIDQVKVNGEVLYEDISESGNGAFFDFIRDVSLKDLRVVSENIPLEEIDFVREGIDMNLRAANEGLNSNLGLRIGSTLNRLHTEGKLNIDVFTKARILTAAACDMRMGGGNCPIMTSGGSGNQGIGVIVPIAVVAEYENIEEEKLIRAVFFAHLINRYVKMFTGKLSSICGCAIAAGVGASAAITWMLGGDDEKIAGSCNNMLANLTGMICDGAKDTCAFKLSTSAEEAVVTAYLANEGVIAEGNVGIVGDSIEDTIRNLGYLCEEGLDHADSAIINIINKGE
ncbi:L-serine ammonia-lyase, iron-sulfur-dependent, subunit alpha [Tissierella sp. Yu-01]|uniref:L-cysteine desulfidase family protein n=1 Tax=Tissierella sp. Yu-01 TaxID=3035694 RepID=UPI00240DBD64|nr:L-serine ammonia-lyase, iron-sulfur-dependent, subunit alpha [Tissierella sp. Yu-01]WFA08635.1 L-serine ammonia-lyase, iron-sulfur-dependent, subunit alpha [Tissierella sp. Yu-01]